MLTKYMEEIKIINENVLKLMKKIEDCHKEMLLSRDILCNKLTLKQKEVIEMSVKSDQQMDEEKSVDVCNPTR